MGTSNELMYAILAMDSYNRGYGAGIEGLGGAGTSIGTAVIQDFALPQGSEAAAYRYNGETVISYRGTDDFIKDPLYGWGVGTGNA